MLQRFPKQNTLRVDTKSAVSSSVNWLIWSTIPDILALPEPAIVLSHRRKGARLLC